MSFDPAKYEEFGIELVKRIKATTVIYRRKWNKIQANLPAESKLNPIGEAYAEFVGEAEICKSAQAPLQALIEAITGKTLVIPGEAGSEPVFPDLPPFAAIVNIGQGGVNFIGVRIDNTEEYVNEVHLGSSQVALRVADIDTYSGKDKNEVRVATATEIDQWAEHFLTPDPHDHSNTRDIATLYGAWLAFCQ